MNQQSRKWLITINNPLQAGLTRERILEIIATLASVSYFAIVDEIGESKTPHTHVFLYSKSPVRFTTLQRKFKIAHIDKCIGTCSENRDYLLKSGKWANTSKSETTVEGSFAEYGTMPKEKDEKVSEDLLLLLEKVEEGKSIREILSEMPKYAMHTRNLEALKSKYYAEKFLTEKRKVSVIYIYDVDGSYSRKDIYDAETNICRISSYRANGISFDAYHYQDAILFDNFEGQINVRDLLSFLDGYPIFLPARYEDRIACYTTAYIVSSKNPKLLYSDRNLERSIEKLLKLIDCYLVCKDGITTEVNLKGEGENGK